MTGSIVLPFAITYSDPEDLFEDGLEWGLVLTWPVFVLGALVVGVSVLVAAF